MTQSLTEGGPLLGLEPHPGLPIPQLPLEAKCLSAVLYPRGGGGVLEGCGLNTVTTTKGMCQNAEPSCY